MNSVYRALIEAILHIELRDVPDDIADDDVVVLDYIFSELSKLDRQSLSEFLSVVHTLKNDSSTVDQKEVLNNLIDSLEAR